MNELQGDDSLQASHLIAFQDCLTVYTDLAAFHFFDSYFEAPYRLIELRPFADNPFANYLVTERFKIVRLIYFIK